MPEKYKDRSEDYAVARSRALQEVEEDYFWGPELVAIIREEDAQALNLGNIQSSDLMVFESKSEEYSNVLFELGRGSWEVLKFIATAPFHPLQDWNISRPLERLNSLKNSGICVTTSLLLATDVGIYTNDPAIGVAYGVASWVIVGLGADVFLSPNPQSIKPSS